MSVLWKMIAALLLFGAAIKLIERYPFILMLIVIAILLTVAALILNLVKQLKKKIVEGEAQQGDKGSLVQEPVIVISGEDSRIWGLGERSYQLTRMSQKDSCGSLRSANACACSKNDPVEFTPNQNGDGYVAWCTGMEIGELPRVANDFCEIASLSRLHGAIESVSDSDPVKIRVRIWFK